MKLVRLLAFLLFISVLQASAADLPSAVSKKAQELIATSGADVAVAFRTLDGETELLINPDEVFHAASTMKVPVLIELFAQAQEGKLSLDDPLKITNEFHSIVDGSPYQLEPADDSDLTLYDHIGQTLPLREVARRMIVRSSNLAANLLIEKLGAENIQRRTDALGASGMKVLRGVEDGKAYERGLNNTTTARALLRLLEALANSQAVSPDADRQMIEILKQQELNDGIPLGLPPGTPVAHKDGRITAIHHDGAVVYGPRPFVLVILVRGLEDIKDSAALMAGITKTLWQATQPAP